MQTVKSARWTTDQYGNSVRLAATATSNGVATYGDNQDAASTLAEYNKYRDIDRLMRQRHGVNM